MSSQVKQNKYRDYHEQNDINNTLKLREIITTLPGFCRDFFLGIKDTTSTSTRLAYAYDLRIFFEFLHETNPACQKTEIEEFDIRILDMLKPMDITEYLDYLTYYVK